MVNTRHVRKIAHGLHCHCLAPNGNIGPCSRFMTRPPAGMGRRFGRKKAELLDWNKDSLKEQQRQQTVRIMLIRAGEYTEQLSMPHVQCAPKP